MSRINRRRVHWLMVWMMVSTPCVASAQDAAVQRAGEPAVREPLADWAYAEAGFALLAHPRRVMAHPAMRLLPSEVFEAASKQELGFNPLDAESILLVVEPPLQGPPAGAMAFRFSQPFAMSDLSPKLTQSAGPYRFGLANETTLVMGMPPAFDRLMQAAKTPHPGPLASVLDQHQALDLIAVLDVAQLRPLLAAVLQNPPPIAAPFDELIALPTLIDRIELQGDLTVSGKFSLVVNSASAEDAAEVERIVMQSLNAGRQLAIAQVEADLKREDDPVAQATGQYARRITQMMLDTIRPQRTDKQLAFATSVEIGAAPATVAMLVGLLLPAVQAAREAARRAQAMNNVKQLALALINYEATYAKFPARANFNDQGEPLLSWRVHILPFLDENELYREFHLDEPWDSEHNRKLIDRMPVAFRNPNLPFVDRTNYLVPVGPGTMFEGNEGLKIRKIKDGTSKTISIVEADADRAVIWTKPEDLTYDPERPLEGLGHVRPGGFVFARLDGSVGLMAVEAAEAVIRAMMTYDGGERVDQ